MKHMVTDIKAHIEIQEAQLALRVSNSAYNGDLSQLKSLIRAGANPNKTNFDGRSPLHLAASKGHVDIALFLIEEGVDVNHSDNFGNTPLLEAIKSGNEKIAALLIKEGSSLILNDANPNLKDYDFRSPLHVAISRGYYGLAKLLVDSGASVMSKDRWGNTPLDEARLSGNEMLIKLLEEAKASQLSKFPSTSQGPSVTDKTLRRKCTVYPFRPWDDPKDQNKFGVVLWVPDTIDELMKTAAEHFKLDLTPTSCIITKDAGQILDVDFITNAQRLYLITT